MVLEKLKTVTSYLETSLKKVDYIYSLLEEGQGKKLLKNLNPV
jgi:hypothetical protein